MPNSTRIVYLSNDQYNNLIINRSITVDGVTVEYNENDLYVTPQANPTVETINVSGTDPVIAAQENFRYVCGEVSTLNFTPSANGLCEVLFTSGTSPTILMLPNTVKMPEWWIDVETERIYDIIIRDGVYGVVMSWPT